LGQHHHVAGQADPKQRATALIESLGGTVESFHFALGKTDAYVITDMPDAAATKKILYRRPGN